MMLLVGSQVKSNRFVTATARNVAREFLLYVRSCRLYHCKLTSNVHCENVFLLPFIFSMRED